MRSSEDEACCDMLIASPEAPDRRGNLDHRKNFASSFHGKGQESVLWDFELSRIGPWIATTPCHERQVPAR